MRGRAARGPSPVRRDRGGRGVPKTGGPKAVQPSKRRVCSPAREAGPTKVEAPVNRGLFQVMRQSVYAPSTLTPEYAFSPFTVSVHTPAAGLVAVNGSLLPGRLGCAFTTPFGSVTEIDTSPEPP